MENFYKLVLSNPLVRNYLNKKFGINPEFFELGFKKEDGLWYADIKNWPKHLKHNCLMVGGAAEFLENVPKSNPNYITYKVSLTERENFIHLIKKHEDSSGGTYYSDNATTPDMWLCNVTKFVFGEHPEEMWIQSKE